MSQETLNQQRVAQEELTPTLAQLTELRERTLRELKGFGFSEHTIRDAKIERGSSGHYRGVVNGYKIIVEVLDDEKFDLDPSPYVTINGIRLRDVEKAKVLVKAVYDIYTIHHLGTDVETQEKIRREQNMASSNRNQNEEARQVDEFLLDIIR